MYTDATIEKSLLQYVLTSYIGGAQATSESYVSLLLKGLHELNYSSECITAAAEFLCLYYFGLCDNLTRQVYFPSYNQCTITVDVYIKEFEKINEHTRIFGRELLPSCDCIPKAAEPVNFEGMHLAVSQLKDVIVKFIHTIWRVLQK